MRWTGVTLAFFLWMAVGSTIGDECGTIDETGATIETGVAPVRGTRLIDPCGGPGVRPDLDLASGPAAVGAMTAIFADQVSFSPVGHETSVTGTFEGGAYTFDNYVVPAGTTITYTSATSILVFGEVSIHGTVRTDAPGAGIHIEAGETFVLENEPLDPAVIETTGNNSHIEIRAGTTFTSGMGSRIEASHGDVLISAHTEVDGARAVDMRSTRVLARDGALQISAREDIFVHGGYFAGDPGGVRLRATLGRITIEDAALDGGPSERGVDVRARESLTVRGLADLACTTGPIRLVSYEADLHLDGVYSIYTSSGDQEYSCEGELLIEGGSSIYSESGRIRLAHFARTLSQRLTVDSSQITTGSGDIQVHSPLIVALAGDSLLHSDSGTIRMDIRTLFLKNSSRLGRGAGSFGPIEIRCEVLQTYSSEPGIGIYGSEISLHVKLTYAVFDLTTRAETGDLRLRTGGAATNGRFSARGDILIDVDMGATFDGASFETDDRTEGDSGSIHLTCWGEGDSAVQMIGSVVTTGRSSTKSGDIRILIRTAPTVGRSWILPRIVTLEEDIKDPSRTRITMSGYCDLGDGEDLTAAAELLIGGLTIPVSGLTPNAAGTKFTVNSGGLALKLIPSKKGTSRGKFKLVYTGDLTGKVDPAGDLAIRYSSDGIDATGTVRLTSGKFKLRKVGGALLEPGVWVSKAKASVRGAGKDTLSLVLGLALDGTVPAAAADLTLSFGDDLSVTIPADSFTRKGDKDEFRGDVDGITRVVVDWTKQTVKVTGRNLDLSTIPEGPSSLAIRVAIGPDARATGVKMVRTGKRLRY